MWSPADDRSRLALLLCSACAGCPDNDPRPHGVIRQGVAYSDKGHTLPICPTCGYPDHLYSGGSTETCSRCRVPDIAIPSCRGTRAEQIASMVADGWDDGRIGWSLGLATETVRKLRQQHRILRQPAPLPVSA